MKQIVAFDVDGTLTESKSALDEEMAELVCKLLSKTKVVIISGGSFTQFQKQILNYLECPNSNLKNLYLLPTNGSSFFIFKDLPTPAQAGRQAGKWERVYSETLTSNEKEKIFDAFSRAFKDIAFVIPKKIYGILLEDRDTQITFSGLGSDAPIELKEVWDPDHKKRLGLKKALEKYIPEFEVSIGGTTSLDITRKGIDKAYATKKIMEYLSVSKENIVFIGDALFPGGNDYSVKEFGIETIEVKSPQDTKRVIEALLELE